jgi:HPt (histidine-containing phosphotransfer) domain-containing protein
MQCIFNRVFLSPEGVYGINAAKGLALMGGQVKIYARMLDKFVANTIYQDFVAAVNSGDSAAQKAHAHALKGVTANLSLEPLYHTIMNIEADTKSDITIDPADPRMAALADEYDKAIASIRLVLENPDILKP